MPNLIEAKSEYAKMTLSWCLSCWLYIVGWNVQQITFIFFVKLEHVITSWEACSKQKKIQTLATWQQKRHRDLYVFLLSQIQGIKRLLVSLKCFCPYKVISSQCSPKKIICESIGFVVSALLSCHFWFLFLL